MSLCLRRTATPPRRRCGLARAGTLPSAAVTLALLLSADAISAASAGGNATTSNPGGATGPDVTSAGSGYLIGALDALVWAVAAGEALLPWLAQGGNTAADAAAETSPVQVAQATTRPETVTSPQPPPVYGNGNGRGNGDVFDRNAPPSARHRLAPSWWWGGDVKLEYDLEDNFNLDRGDPDKLETIEPQLEVTLFFKTSPGYDAFFDFELLREYAITEEGKNRDRHTKLMIKRAYIRFEEALDETEAIVGRQRIKDKREWYYDEALDGIRAVAELDRIEIDASISRQNIVNENILSKVENDRTNNYLLELRAEDLGPDLDLSGFFVVRDDRSDEEGTPFWLGARVMGEASEQLTYWADAAFVGGDPGVDKDQPNADDLRGYGLDAGATYVLEGPLAPSFTLSYALGSGDSNPDDGTDRNFRQTGLQDNNARFNGVTRFKYYGELFEPELSNLKIFTAGVGVKPSRETSIDLVYHRYRQDVPFDELRDSNLDEDPNGDSRSLGEEIDLIVGMRKWHDIDVEFIAGHFTPGNAFSRDADSALFVNLEARYRF